jgi:hypothetical protein
MFVVFDDLLTFDFFLTLSGIRLFLQEVHRQQQ